MPGGPRPVHPLYPDLTDADWAAAEDAITYLVAGKIGTTLGDPRDFAIEVVRRAYEPTAPVWDRSKRSLAMYLGSFANSLMANGIRRLEVSTTSGLKASHLARLSTGGESPEDAAIRAEADANAVRLFKKVRDEVSDDVCCTLLLDAFQRGERDGSKQANAAGFTSAQVTHARARMSRAVKRVMTDEARAAARGKKSE